MGLQSEIILAMKEAMKLKDKVSLETLRAVKAELLKIQTASGASSKISRAEEIKLLQKMQKQRKDASLSMKSKVVRICLRRNLLKQKYWQNFFQSK